MTERAGKGSKRPEGGVSLFLVALGLTVLLGIAGLAVDLATLYVARNEAQRAADAAALAGAKTFQSTSYSDGLMTSGQVMADAMTQATQVGNQNLIIGLSPNLVADSGHFNSTCPPPSGVSGGCFNFSVTSDPQITVVVLKDMPTYFMRIFGVSSVPVSVTATAEAYTPLGGNGPNSAVTCLKPWLLPNCDQGTPPISGSDPNANTLCPESGGFAPYFVNNGAIVRPGLQPTGAIGEKLIIKPGNPQATTVSSPSKFWPVFLPSNGTFTCPSCASADQQNSTSNSAALYRENIECCSTTEITCGTNYVNPISGDMTGPTGQGVDCLIHENNSGSGQDCISFDSTASQVCPGVATSLSLPYTMFAGSTSGPDFYGVSEGTPISTSDSLVTLPLYNGATLCPGNSCPSSVSVQVQGFIELFIRDEGPPSSTVTAFVLNISLCSGGNTGSTGGGGVPLPAVAGTPITVRLIHND